MMSATISSTSFGSVALEAESASMNNEYNKEGNMKVKK